MATLEPDYICQRMWNARKFLFHSYGERLVISVNLTVRLLFLKLCSPPPYNQWLLRYGNQLKRRRNAERPSDRISHVTPIVTMQASPKATTPRVSRYRPLSNFMRAPRSQIQKEANCSNRTPAWRRWMLQRRSHRDLIWWW